MKFYDGTELLAILSSISFDKFDAFKKGVKNEYKKLWSNLLLIKKFVKMQHK